MPKLVADALGVLVVGVLVTVVLLLAAVGLLVAALGTGHVGLAWGSVALSAVAAGMILRRWRRSWLQRQDELVVLSEDEPVDAGAEQLLHPASVSAQQEVDPVTASVEVGAVTGEAQLGEEDTDAADLLVVYELTDEVLVLDEHPRYHLARCPSLVTHPSTDRLPVREARELGFTPCGRCRPDTMLARKHRAARASTGGG